jgi:hypothetical protein
MEPWRPKGRARAADAPRESRRRFRDDDDDLEDSSQQDRRSPIYIIGLVAVLACIGLAGLAAGGVTWYVLANKSKSGSPSDASATSKDSSSSAEPLANYCPLKARTKWRYRVTANGVTATMTREVAKIEVIDGQSLARIDSIMDGNLVGSEHLANNDKGLFRHRYDGVPFEPPICILKYPVKEGESWPLECRSGNDRMTGICTCAMEEVTVPAGKFKTVKVIVIAQYQGQSVSGTYWLAAGVGIVKQTVDMAGGTMDLELERVEMGP